MMINMEPRFQTAIRLTLWFYTGAKSIESQFKFQPFKSIQSKIIRKQKQAEVFCSENHRKFGGFIHLSSKQLGKYIKLYNFPINSQLTQNYKIRILSKLLIIFGCITRYVQVITINQNYFIYQTLLNKQFFKYI
ncbi:Hypothetical_protein [Hexamita inflata]|uniref:Hypothetical_protein n=1 Tax=Hexamita inflata TaxID=28002 RepID=A0AA86TTB3_9EUKA|nr:Hypothetical protein HINF_LOCUS15571 [Hexamita inflata]